MIYVQEFIEKTAGVSTAKLRKAYFTAGTPSSSRGLAGARLDTKKMGRNIAKKLSIESKQEKASRSVKGEPIKNIGRAFARREQSKSVVANTAKHYKNKFHAQDIKRSVEKRTEELSGSSNFKALGKKKTTLAEYKQKRGQ